jgi:hypothetical protein
LAYDGSELRPHFLRTKFGLKGDGVAIFRGPCHVDDQLVDLEDREKGAFIHSRDMLHLIAELFQVDLPSMVLLQRLTASLIADRVRASLDPMSPSVVRRGDDVYVGNGKLTVSIATVSPVSALMHFGINIDTRDTPVETSGLAPLGIDEQEFAEGLLSDLQAEIRAIIGAACKVRPVFEGPRP